MAFLANLSQLFQVIAIPFWSFPDLWFPNEFENDNWKLKTERMLETLKFYSIVSWEVDVIKVTTDVLFFELRLTLNAASGGMKVTCVFTPLDGSAGVIYGRRNVL